VSSRRDFIRLSALAAAAGCTLGPLRNQDETFEPVLESLKESYTHLRTLKV
jgi:hypothetical protein